MGGAYQRGRIPTGHNFGFAEQPNHEPGRPEVSGTLATIDQRSSGDDPGAEHDELVLARLS